MKSHLFGCDGVAGFDFDNVIEYVLLQQRAEFLMFESPPFLVDLHEKCRDCLVTCH